MDARMPSSPQRPQVISFYKLWDPYGALSNFSPHPISLPDESGAVVLWNCVEHYYQAQKFAGVEDEVAQECVRSIRRAESPEEAARIGRTLARTRPDLVRDDWAVARISAMETALQAKYATYPALRDLLLSTAGAVLVEASQNDMFWGAGRGENGENKLGLLLMQLRSQFLQDSGPGDFDGPSRVTESATAVT